MRVESKMVEFEFVRGAYAFDPLTIRWGKFKGQGTTVNEAMEALIVAMREKYNLYQKLANDELSADANAEKTSLGDFFTYEPQRHRHNENDDT